MPPWSSPEPQVPIGPPAAVRYSDGMIAYSEVWAFTPTPGQGNRAGVVLDAAALSDADMQGLATFLEAPETVFVIRRGDGRVRVRYFTPTQEVEFCGHATVALGLMLAQAGLWQGEALELETLTGRVPLRLVSEAGVPVQVWMRQRRHETRAVPPAYRHRLAEALGISDRMIHRGLPLASASSGLWSVFVPLLDPVILDALEPDFPAIEALSVELGVGSVYAYTPLGVNRFAARDFAPLVGIPEDPVTGSAAGAVLGLLAHHGRLPVRGERACGVIYQGHALGTPGEVEVEIELEGTTVTGVHVGGCAVLDHEGHWRP